MKNEVERELSNTQREKEMCEREKKALNESLAEAHEAHLQSLTEILAGLTPLAQATVEVT